MQQATLAATVRRGFVIKSISHCSEKGFRCNNSHCSKRKKAITNTHSIAVKKTITDSNTVAVMH